MMTLFASTLFASTLMDCPFCDHEFEADTEEELVTCPNCGEEVMVPIYEGEEE